MYCKKGYYNTFLVTIIFFREVGSQNANIQKNRVIFAIKKSISCMSNQAIEILPANFKRTVVRL